MAGISAGVPLPGQRFDPNNSPIAPSNGNTLFGSPGSFAAAATTQAGDYDKIMDTYKQLGTRSASFNPLTPQLAPGYNPSAATISGTGALTDLASTGGYSPSGIADLRARGIAPVRSIYSTAQQGLERSKNLSGGYSPNFAAASGKMARDMSDIIGQKETDVNAGIAQNVAQNKLQAAPALAAAGQEQDRARMAREEANNAIVNQINQINESIRLQVQAANNQNLLSSAEGMRSLFGTTPAMASMFGQHVAEAAQLGQGQQEINNRRTQAQQGLASSILGRTA